jgi:hypothetical protein
MTDIEPVELPLEIDDELVYAMRFTHQGNRGRRYNDAYADGPCHVHRAHKPEPLRVIRHAILPIAMGGSATDEDNLLDICDTGHFNVHLIFGLLLLGRAMPHGHNAEKKIALTGYHDWVRSGKPGELALASFAS